MNNAQVEIIKQTVPVLQEHGETLTKRFYENMFNNNPELKRFFNPAHQYSVTQHLALAGAICAYAANIEDPTALAGAVDLIAHKHVSLGIKPEHYPIVGNNLILTIKEILGDAANDDVIDAWTAAYGQLVDIFVEHEKYLKKKKKEKHGWNGFKPFNVVKKVRESNNIISYHLQPNDGNPVVAHKPGQYITINLMIDDKPVMRNYSLSNAPGENVYRISVKREPSLNPQTPDGLVSNHLHEHYQVGDNIDLAPPSGEFTLHIPEVETQPIVLIAGGVGITPIISMLYDLLNKSASSSRPVYLFMCVKELAVLPFANELKILANEHANFHWQVHLSQESSTEKTTLENVYHDRFSLASLERVFDREQPLAIHACGPAGLIKELTEMVRVRNQSKDTLHYEFFGPAQAV